MEIDHEIFSTTIRLPSADSRRAVVSYKRKYAHEALVNRLVKLVQEKLWLGEMTVPDMDIAVEWDVKQQTKPSQKIIQLYFEKQGLCQSEIFDTCFRPHLFCPFSIFGLQKNLSEAPLKKKTKNRFSRPIIA